jgi:hypothetical protein
MSFSSSWGLSLESVQLRGVTSCASIQKAVKMYNAVTYNAVTYNAVTYNAVTYNAVTYNAVTYNAVTYNAVNTLPNKRNKNNNLMHAYYICIISQHGPFKTESRRQLSGVQAAGAG